MAREDKDTILLFCDHVSNTEDLVACLSPMFRLLVAKTEEKAHALLSRNVNASLLLLNCKQALTAVSQFKQTIDNNPLIDHVGMVVLSCEASGDIEEQCFERGVVDFMYHPITASTLLARIQNHLALMNQQRALKKQVNVRTEELVATKIKLIHRLAAAAEYRDDESAAHLRRIAHYSAIIAKGFGAHPDWCRNVFYAAPLHDIGKIALPDNILNSMACLNDAEKQQMQSHTYIGANILNDSEEPLLVMAANIALTHHERYDGTGYPMQMQGEDIPLEGRIVALADSFDALQTDKSYRPALSLEDTVVKINDAAGTQFDPNLVAVFNRELAELAEVRALVEEEAC